MKANASPMAGLVFYPGSEGRPMLTTIFERRQRRELCGFQSKAFARWLQRNRGPWKEAGFVPVAEELSVPLRDDPLEHLAELRALSVNAGSAGGYTVPQTFQDALESALLYASAIRDSATVMRVERGGVFRWPTCDDTEVCGYILPENATPSLLPNDITTFGSLDLFDQKWTSGWILLPSELIEDAPPQFAAWLGDLLGRRIGRGQNTAFTASVLASAAQGAKAASSTAIAGNDLIALMSSVDVSYRERPGCCWQMNNATLQAVRTLTDSVGRYLFEPRRRPDEPDMLLGFPVRCNRDLTATLTSGAQPVLFGDFSKVVVKDVKELRLRRLVERYGEYDQEGFVGFLRSDCEVQDAGTHPLKYLVN